MEYNCVHFSHVGKDSNWDADLSASLCFEIINIDEANRRKRKALKQMTKAIKKRNASIEELEQRVKQLEKEIDDLTDLVRTISGGN